MVFETNLAKRTEKATTNRSRGSKIALGGLKRGLAGTLSLQKGPWGGARSPLGGQKGENVLFLRSLLGSKMGHNPLKSDLEIIKKHVVFMLFLASGGPRGAPGGRLKTGPKTEADGSRLAARIWQYWRLRGDVCAGVGA